MATTLVGRGQGRARRPGSRLRWRNTIIGWSFILPNFIGFAALTLIPLLALGYVAFTDWNAFGVANWVGLPAWASGRSKPEAATRPPTLPASTKTAGGSCADSTPSSHRAP